MVNKINPLKETRKGCGVLEFKYGKSHHKTYESKFILIIARTFSGKSFLTVNLLCSMDLKNKYKQVTVICPDASNKNECYTSFQDICEHAGIDYKWYDSVDDKFKKIKTVDELVNTYKLPEHNFIVLDDIYPLSRQTKQLIVSILSKGRHYKQNAIICLQSHTDVTNQSILSQVSHFFINSQILKRDPGFLPDKLKIMPSNLNEILTDEELMNDPHQFFMLKQGSDDLTIWTNPDCGSKQNVYKMVKKRKWTEEDSEKEKREEQGEVSGSGLKRPNEHISTYEKKMKKFLPVEEEVSLKGIERDEKDKPKESILQIIQDQIIQDSQRRIFNPYLNKKHYSGYPSFH
ncbi:hypothetical protein WA158_007633 [Blastocystis sp. Blastoise]